MLRLVPALILTGSLCACGSTSNRGAEDSGNLPRDRSLRTALTGPFHGYWTGASSGTVLRSKAGALLEVPVVLDADLAADYHWNMDATDRGEEILEAAGHYNSSVWFVATQIEVQGSRIYITKDEDNYEDTLCLELVGLEGGDGMRFQAHAFLADPGQGERDRCLAGAVEYDATLLLHRGPGDAPEFTETGTSETDDFSAEPPGNDDDSSEDGDDGSSEESDEL